MHPASKIEGKATYYYAYIEHTKSDLIDLDKVLPFKAYLENL